MHRPTQARRNQPHHRLQSPPLRRKLRGHRLNPRLIAPQSLLCLLCQSFLKVPAQQHDHIVTQLSLRLRKRPAFPSPRLKTETLHRQLPQWPSTRLLSRKLLHHLKCRSSLQPHHRNHGPTLYGPRLRPLHKFKLRHRSPMELVVARPRAFRMCLMT